LRFAKRTLNPFESTALANEESPMNSHIIFGAGPVGHATATELLARGEQVTVVTRSGKGEMPSGVRRVQADAANAADVINATKGATTIYNCVNPEYANWTTDWPPIHQALLGAAERHSAALVIMGNLYGYGSLDRPFRESDRLAAAGPKGRVRAQMWESALAAHQAGRVRVTEARASDFIGPRVEGASMGDRVIPNVLASKAVSLLGRSDVPHAVTAMHDVGVALATLGTDDRAYGRAWHVPTAPARTQREIVHGLCAAAGVKPVKVRTLPSAMLAVVGVFVPMMRELREVEYQFAKPFDLDSTDFTATFDVKPTPLDDTLAATVAWYRQSYKK
jgi:nucleoside-diphosphate-sugar epimerase